MAVDFDALVVGPTMSIFGDSYQYSSPAGTFQIVGVFNEAYLDIDPLGRGGIASEGANWGGPGTISGSMPVLGVQMRQFIVPPAQGDLVLVKGVTYTVREARPDGQGGALLFLNQFSD